MARRRALWLGLVIGLASIAWLAACVARQPTATQDDLADDGPLPGMARLGMEVLVALPDYQIAITLDTEGK